MKLFPLVFCVVLISLLETTLQSKIMKPKLNLVQSQNFKSPTAKNKSPEERRNLSLFPKNKRKFMVSAESPSKSVTHNPAVLARKKPLMKKIVPQDKIPNLRNVVVENETKQPQMGKKRFSNNLFVSKNLKPVVTNKEVSKEVDKEVSVDSYNPRIDNILADNKLHKDNNELIMTVPDITTKGLKDLIVTPKYNPVEINQENKKDKSFKNSSHVINKSKEDENADMDEFIFLDPVPSSTEIAMINDEEASEELITTDIPDEPKIVRRKRSSNIIEEENLATTVAGYKYTWKDTRLDSNLVFKNINS